MTPERGKQIEGAGFAVESAEDALGLDAIDREIVAFRLAIAGEVRRVRGEKGMTRNELAARVEVSQSRITGIEKGVAVSLECVAAAYILLGGDLMISNAPAETPVEAKPSAARPAMQRPGGIAKRKAPKARTSNGKKPPEFLESSALIPPTRPRREPLSPKRA